MINVWEMCGICGSDWNRSMKACCKDCFHYPELPLWGDEE